MVTVIDRIVLRIEAASRGVENQLQRLQVLFLSMGLAFLFTGMAVKKLFQTILMSLFQLFLQVEGEGGVLNNLVGNLAAEFAFLKFSFIDAFKESKFFDIWQDRLERVIAILNNLTDEQKAKLVDFAIKGFLVATAMMTIGMALLFMLGPLGLVFFLFKNIIELFSIVRIGILAIGAPIALLIAGFILVAFWIGFVIKKLGGLKEFFVGLITGILQLLNALVFFIVDKVVAVIQMILSSMAQILDVLGIDTAAELLRGAGRNLRQGTLNLATDISGFIDRMNIAGTSAREIRNEINLTVEGDVKDEDTVDRIINGIIDKLGSITGSPQS